jgi:hypothetical protein
MGATIMAGPRRHTSYSAWYRAISPALIAGLLVASLSSHEHSYAAAVDVTPEWLGNPFATTYYPNYHMARNVWDMQVWGTRIYLGNGDSGLNTGPTPMVYYDTSAEQFVNDGYVDDEAIDHFNILNGVLAAPGDDAREDASFSNFYTRDAAGWTKHRTLPNGLHTFDLHSFSGILFASYTISNPSPILSSSDNGATWSPQLTNNWSADAFFELGGSLYTQTFPDTDLPGPYANYYKYNPSTCSPARLGGLRRGGLDRRVGAPAPCLHVG